MMDKATIDARLMSAIGALAESLSVVSAISRQADDERLCSLADRIAQTLSAALDLHDARKQ